MPLGPVVEAASLLLLLWSSGAALGVRLAPESFVVVTDTMPPQIGEATRSHALIDGVLGLLEGNRNAFFA